MATTKLATVGRRQPKLDTILVPHDLSADSSVALRLAAEIAAGSGCTLHLMHAIDSLSVAWATAEPIWLAGIASATDEERDRARCLLREVAERHGVSARLHIVIGPPARAICALAREIRADLIVMTTRRRSVWERALRRGVLLRTLWQAPCCVLSIPESGCGASE